MAEKMKAVVKTKPGPGAEYLEVDIPRCGPDEVLVKVHATSICGTDLHIYEWNQWAASRIKTPQIMGHELAGEVVEVGRNVHFVKVGDKISAETHIPCGHCYQCRTGRMAICRNLKIFGVDRDGVFAEYAVVPEVDVIKNDPAVPYEFASVQEPLGNAVDTVLSEDVAGKTVAVMGAGPVGLFGIAVARASGASAIYVTEVNEYRLNLARKLGATETFNPRATDVVAEIIEATDGNGVDVALEMSGNAEALRQALRVTTPGGRVSILGLYNGNVTLDLNNDVVFKALRIYGVTGRTMFQTWYKSAGFIKSGLIDLRTIITHTFPLAEFEMGMQLMAEGNCGKIVLVP
ncbi:MAG: L-threonine 3-dehydrogenase [bacterium]|jgi:threonine 3-dehydrogenase|nr:L-threonine 3-dehydrogenase [candidate division KSB1 bacterium]MDH7558825.1 L-threonine 3-dehydrogenase [bacterium]